MVVVVTSHTAGSLVDDVQSNVCPSTLALTALFPFLPPVLSFFTDRETRNYKTTCNIMAPLWSFTIDCGRRGKMSDFLTVDVNLIKIHIMKYLMTHAECLRLFNKVARCWWIINKHLDKKLKNLLLMLGPMLIMILVYLDRTHSRLGWIILEQLWKVESTSWASNGAGSPSN